MTFIRDLPKYIADIHGVGIHIAVMYSDYVYDITTFAFCGVGVA